MSGLGFLHRFGNGRNSRPTRWQAAREAVVHYCGYQMLEERAMLSLNPDTIALTASPNPAWHDQTVALTATVDTGGAGTATGPVTFYQDYGTGSQNSLGTGTLNANDAATLDVATLAAGNDAITAVYAGDSSFESSTSAALTETVNMAATTTDLSASPSGPTTYGQTITFTAVVNTSDGSAGTPTGTVSFYDDSAQPAALLGTAALPQNGTTVSLDYAALGAGVHSIVADYSGDGTFNPSGSTATSYTVDQAQPSVSLSSAPNPSQFDQSVAFTATVTPPDGGAATGTVAFYDDGDALNQKVLLGSATLSGGTAVYSDASLPVGTRYIEADYVGDSNFTAADSSPTTHDVSQVATTTTLDSSPNPVEYGQTLTLTASVVGAIAAAGVPTGTVTFSDENGDLATVPLDSTGAAQLSISTLAAGSHTLTASFQGDYTGFEATFANSASVPVSQTITEVPTSTTLTSSGSPALAGQPVTFTATVSGLFGNLAGQSENVALVENYGMANANPIATQPVNGNVATFTVSNLPAGDHSLVAVYQGDGNFASSASNVVPEAVVQASSNVVLTTSASPVTSGKTVDFTVQVTSTASGAGTATGPVTLYENYGTPDASVIGSPQDLSGGEATFSEPTDVVDPTTQQATLGPGHHLLTAVYDGDTTFAPNISNTIDQLVSQDTTTIALSTSGSPSNSGDPVTLTATVSTAATGDGDPSGNVFLFEQYGSHETLLDTKALASKSAQFTLSNLAAGSYALVAVYGGDATFSGAISNTVTQIVNPTSTGQLSETTTTLSASPNPSAPGQAVTFTATVTSAGGGTPTGNVSFYADGYDPSGIYPPFDTQPLVNGVATSSTSNFAQGGPSQGPTSIIAVYEGDSSNNVSFSNTIEQTVALAATSTSLQSSLTSAQVGDVVTLTVTVASLVAGLGTPGGTVGLYENYGTMNASQVGTAATLSGGSATINYTVAAGNTPLVAIYSGDNSVFDASVSNTVTETTNSPAAADTTTSLTVSPNPAVLGQAITLSASVTAVGGGTPTGQVDFYADAGTDPTGMMPGTYLGTGTLSAGAASASVSAATLGAGAHYITAVYTSDNSSAFNSGQSDQVEMAVNPDGTTVSLTSSPPSGNVGDPVTFTATLTPGVDIGVAFTGTVSFYDDIGATYLGAGTWNGATATYTTSTLTAGTHQIVAQYGGDSNFQSAYSNILAETISVAIKADASISLAASANPAWAGQPLTLTATVTSGSGTPTGSVDFYENRDGVDMMGNPQSPILLRSVQVDANGTAVLTTSSLAPGYHNLVAVYSGDSAFNSGTSSAIEELIQQADTSVTLASSGSPAAQGQLVTFTAGVSSNVAGLGSPTGSVAFYDNYYPGATPLGTVSLSGATASFSTSSLAVGSHPILAVYLEDATFAPGLSPVVNQSIDYQSTTTLVASKNPSFPGDPVTLTATVAPAGATGYVTFKDGSNVLGVVGLPSSGQAALTVSFAAGMHYLTASYGGDVFDLPSTSAVLAQAVNQLTVVATVPLASKVGPVNGVFTLTRQGDLTSALTAPYSLTPTALNGYDYQYLSGEAYFAPGMATTTVTIVPKTDVPDDGVQTVTLTLQPVPNYFIGVPNSATVTISDQPLPGTDVTLSVSDPNASETGPTGPQPGTFLVSRTGGTDSPVTVYYSLAGTAVNGVDYQTLDRTVVIPAGATSAPITIDPIAIDGIDGDKSVIVTLETDPAYTLGLATSAAIVIADSAPTIRISATKTNAAETGPLGSSTGEFTVTRDGSTSNDLVVYYTLGGSAVDGTDYNSLGGSVTIPAGSSSAAIVVQPRLGPAGDGDKTVSVNLAADPGYTITGPQTAQLTIADSEQVVDFCDLAAGGWSMSQSGGSTSAHGSVVEQGDGYLLSEGDSLLVQMQHPLVVPQGPAVFTFTYTATFDGTDTNSIQDAFEVAYVDAQGQSLVPTIRPDRDSFFNLSKGQPVALGGDTTIINGSVRLDLTSVPAGTLGTLIVRLVNNDKDTATHVLIGCTLEQPPSVSVKLNNDTAPTGPNTAVYQTDGITTDPTVAGQVVAGQGLSKLEAQIDGGAFEDITSSLSGDQYQFLPSGLTPGAHQVTVRATDSLGQVGTAVLNFVYDAPPVAEAGAAQTTTEGAEAVFDGSGSQPTVAGIYSYQWSFSDGSTSNGVSVTHAFQEEGSESGTLTVTDIAGATATSSTSVTVGDAAPVLGALPSPQGVEGGSVSVQIPFTDPGLLDTHTATIAWGDGMTSNATIQESGGAGTLSAQHVYADEGAYQAVVTVADDDGTSASANFAAAIGDINPVVLSASDLSGNAGINLAFTGSFSDQGTLDTHTARIDWGDGTTSAGTISESNGAGTVSADHAYASMGDYAITLVVSDDDGYAGTGTATASIAAALPISISANNITGSEGQSASFSATFNDPDTADTHTASIDWGDGTTSSGTVSETSGTGTVTASHAYADEGNYTAHLVVDDNDGDASATAQVAATIGDATPVVTNISPLAGVEGQTASFTGTFSDSGMLDSHTATIDWGDGTTTAGTVSEAGGLGTVAATHAYAEEGNYTVKLTVADDDHVAGTLTATATVSDATPSVLTASALTGSEGQNLAFTGTFSDTGLLDTHTASIDWGDGTTSAGTVSEANGQGTVTASHTYADEGNYTPKLIVTDDEGVSGSRTATATVGDVTPTVLTISGLSGSEGQAINLSGTFSDTGLADTHTAQIVWGDGATTTGTVSEAGGQGTVTASHVYADEGNYPVQLIVSDDEGVSGTLAAQAAIGDSAPTVLSASNLSGGEGQSLSFSGTFSDPGTLDTHTAQIVWGDGTTSTGTVSEANGQGTVTGSHTYADEGNYAIQLIVADDDGVSASRAATATIGDVLPAILTAGNLTGGEGQNLAFSGTFSDGGVLDTHTAQIDWGDGTTSTGTITEANGQGSVAADHVYADEGSYVITLVVADDDGVSATRTASATIGDATPVISSASNLAGNEGDSLAFSGVFSDAGKLDTHTATIDWGDGTTTAGTVSEANGQGTVTSSHAYAEEGTYTILLSVADDDGITGTRTATATVGDAPWSVIDASNLTGTQAENLNFSGHFADPGPVDTHTATIDWGDGTTTAGTVTEAGGSVTGVHSYVNPGTYNLTLTVLDDDGVSRTLGATATISATPPVVTAASNVQGTEGGSVDFSGAFSDPGINAPHTASIDWGDGSTTAGTVVESNGQGTVTGTHVYADEGNYQITLTVTNSQSLDSSLTATATIGNALIDVLSTSALAGSEGQNLAFSGTFSDPGTVDTHTATIDWGDGTTSTGTVSEAGGQGTVTANHTYLDEGNYPIALVVADDDGLTASRGSSAAIGDAVPDVLTASNLSGTEGVGVAFTGTFADTGVIDTHTANIVWGDGTTTAGTVNESGGQGTVTASHVYLEEGTYAPRLIVTDDDGVSGSLGATATISDATPAVSASNVTGVEGVSAAFSGAFTDTGTLDKHTASIDWGDGTTTAGTVSESAGQGRVSATHVYAEEGSYTIRLVVTDDEGVSATGQAAATIGNATPVVLSASDLSGNEAQTLNFSGTFSDTGTLDTHTASIDWGDGTTSAGTVVESGGQGTVAASHVYADEGNYAITLSVADEDGVSGSKTAAAAIADVLPVVSLSGNATSPEGSSYTLDLNYQDPGYYVLNGWTINWGDGSTSTAAAGASTANHIYASGPNSHTITAAVDTDDGSYNATPLTIDVTNVGPSASPAPTATEIKNAPFTLQAASFSDPGFTDPVTNDPESFTSTINWGDSTPTINGSLTVTQGSAGVLTSGTVSGSHLYSAPGAYTVTVTVTDDAGASSTVDFTIDVLAHGSTKFYVVDQAEHANAGGHAAIFRYDVYGNFVSESNLYEGKVPEPNSSPNGIASSADGGTLWVVDAKHNVYVYQGDQGAYLGSWAAPDLHNPVDITVFGSDVWIVDNNGSIDTVYHYANAASVRSGSLAATDSWTLDPSNTSPTGIVTDGNDFWVTDDHGKQPAVFVYSSQHALLGNWTIDPGAVKSFDPQGITLNPNTPNPGEDLWVLDGHNAQVYRFPQGMTWTGGSHQLSQSFTLLLPDDSHPQGIADPPMTSGIPPILSLDAGAGRAVPAGTTYLISGQAEAFGAALSEVTINGTPVEALDAAAHFFAQVSIAPGDNAFTVTASDSLGQTSSETLDVTGTQLAPGAIDFSQLVPVSSSVAGVYGQTSWNQATQLLYSDLAIKNVGTYGFQTPLLVGVEHISSPDVRVDGAVGTTPQGIPFYNYTSDVHGDVLSPGAATDAQTISFYDPNQTPFTYDLVVLGRLNQPPAFTSVPTITATVGQAYNYAEAAEDLDGDSLSFSDYALLAGPGSLTSAGLSWTPTAADVGTHNVAIEVSDGRGGVAEQDFVITVLASQPNLPPLFTSQPVVDANVNVPYTYQATAADADGDAPLTFSPVTVPDSSMTVSASGLVQWRPTNNETGLQNVTLKVDDGHGNTALQTYQILVQQQPGNDPPVIISKPSTQFNYPAPADPASGDVQPSEIDLGLQPGATATRSVSIALPANWVPPVPTDIGDFHVGDVFGGTADGHINQYSADGTFLRSIDTGYTGEVTGMAFDTAGNLYATDWRANEIVKVSPNAQVLGTVGSGFMNEECIVFDVAGDMFVSNTAKSDPLRQNGGILEFDPQGNLVARFLTGTQVDWMDLEPDQSTMLYTQETGDIKTINVRTGVSGPNFATGILEDSSNHVAYALRILPDGSVLVADSADIKRVDTSGNIIQTYSVTNEDSWFALNLDPDGVSFWSENYLTGNAYKFNIATGAVEQFINVIPKRP